MSVFKRAGVYHYDFTDARGNRRRGSTRVRDKAAALRVEAKERERAALGASPEPIPNLEQATALWFVARVAGKRSEAETARRLEVLLRLLDPAMLITELDTPHIEAAIQARRLEPARSRAAKDSPRAVSNATINRDLIDHTLRPLLRYWRRVRKLPVVDVVWKDLRLPESPPKARERTPGELSVWREQLPEHHRPVMDFLTRYGPRLKEAFFPPEAYNPTTGRITITGRKTGDDHIITLLPEDRPDMAARAGRATRAGIRTVWFKDVRGRVQPITPRGFQSASAKARLNAGLTEGRPAHDFRHHAGTAAMRASGNLMVVKKLLGHRSIISSARYAHASDDDVLDALRRTIDTTPETVEKKDKETG